MYEFYQYKWTASVQKDSRKALKNLYYSIPETEGCKESIPTCGAWCCEKQTPQVFFVEFLNTWNNVLSQWEKPKLAELILRATKVYIDGKPTSGCVFWDKETKFCTQHHTRPYNCRTYGQIPDEEFKPRYEKLKILYQDNKDAIIEQQCGLVKTVGKKPNPADMKDWFEEVIAIEHDLLPSSLIHDKDGGSYRTFHDHILLMIASEKFLSKITTLRLKGSAESKEKFLNELSERLKLKLPDFTKEKL